MKSAKRLITISLCIVMIATSGLSAFASDTPSLWATDHVNKAIEENLVPPNLRANYTKPVSRAEFCALAVALYEAVNGGIQGRKTFDDTNDANVEKAAFIGIVTGVGNNSFDPDGKLSREQAAVILSRLSVLIIPSLPKQEPDYEDNDAISAWAIEAIGRTQASGIMLDNGNKRFSPKDYYTIEQSIVSLLKLFDLLELTEANKVIDNDKNTVTAIEEKTPLGEFFAQDKVSFLRQNASRVIELINIERAKNGLTALTETAPLSAAASARAEELESSFSHTRPNGENNFTVFNEFNIVDTKRIENLGAGQSTPEQILEGWMNSEGHKRNIINQNLTKVGVGVHMDSSGRLYWAMLATN